MAGEAQRVSLTAENLRRAALEAKVRGHVILVEGPHGVGGSTMQLQVDPWLVLEAWDTELVVTLLADSYGVTQLWLEPDDGEAARG